jgi:urease accessory protein
MELESPPSLNGFATDCSSSPDRSGRDGYLRLLFERQGDATILRRSRFTLPLQILSPLALADGTAYLLLLNPTGGILGGDCLRSEITLGENASVCLTTPSANRVYRTSHQSAEQETHIKLATGSTLEYLPDHLIPHPGSSLRQVVLVEMDAGSRGIFFDTFAAGRQALHEQWKFRDLDLRSEIKLNGRLIFLNHLKMIPFSHSRQSLGIMGDFFYAASLTVVDDHLRDWPQILASLRRELENIPNIQAGASLLAAAGISIRFLTNSAIALTETITKLWTAVRHHVFQLPPFDLRKY